MSSTAECDRNVLARLSDTRASFVCMGCPTGQERVHIAFLYAAILARARRKAGQIYLMLASVVTDRRSRQYIMSRRRVQTSFL